MRRADMEIGPHKGTDVGRGLAPAATSTIDERKGVAECRTDGGIGCTP